ncbi:MAG: DinB family protein [Pyrinomonadaceae bacterium]
MNHQTIADIYAVNDEIRKKLIEVVSILTDEQAAFLPDGEKWTIANLIEHVAIVEYGMTRISARLLAQAQKEGKSSDSTAKLSENFSKKAFEAKTLKFEAPEKVHPTGKLTVAESLAKMKENRQRIEELRPVFETVNGSDFKFPHPFMGEISAHEWLALIGGHEVRHLEQIKNILNKLDK